MTDELPPTCAECGRESRDDENPAEEWRTYSKGVGDGVTPCPECAREFSEDG